ncbi:MAG: hemolysin activation protein [Clostridia bacterium]|nr:hemolysin activation protein [Clostridia bacterium]
MEKYKAKTDVPVFMIFFNRPDTLKLVFEAVRQARPSTLFLACDGPRDNREDDKENIKKCKDIVSNIDWECNVFCDYSTKNLGCGMRMYTGITWAFEYVDRLMVLEDDCVPNQDFFPFCEELLERYKNDSRIYMISAMNHLGVYKKTENDYFFAGGCCWGWATWKRAWEQMDYNMSFLQDTYAMQCVENVYPYYKNAIKIGQERKAILDAGNKLSAWTYQSGMAAALNSQFSIIPKRNMITNVGLTADSGHAVSNIRKLPKKSQAYFNAPTYVTKFPLKHPKYVVEDRIYYQLVQKKFKPTVFTKIESVLRRIIFAEKGDFSKMFRKIFKRKK